MSMFTMLTLSSEFSLLGYKRKPKKWCWGANRTLAWTKRRKMRPEKKRQDYAPVMCIASPEYSSCKKWSDLYHSVNSIGSTMMQRVTEN